MRILLLLLLASALTAQEPTIRTTVPLVAMPVSVTDRQGASIEGLTAADFVLLDEGKRRPVRVDVVESGLAPIALVTLIQTSDQSLAALAKIKKVGVMIPLSVVGANGSAAVLTYDSDIKVIQGFTRNADAIAGAFDSLKPSDSGGGRMLDAVDQALDLLAKQPPGQRANILIIGETRDRGSKQRLDDLIPKIQRTGTTVYAMSYSKAITPFTMKADEYQPTGGSYISGLIDLARLAKKNTFNALTQVTGGEQFRFEIKGRLEDDLMRVGKDIHNRYLVSFTPELEEASRFHHVELQVSGHPDAQIRARPGYWSETNR